MAEQTEFIHPHDTPASSGFRFLTESIAWVSGPWATSLFHPLLAVAALVVLIGLPTVFTTKGDNRVWSYNPTANTLTVVYDAAVNVNGVLSGVDNVETSDTGVVYVCEDGGDMQIVLLREDGSTFPVVQIDGNPGSEICGAARSPRGGARGGWSSRWVSGGGKGRVLAVGLGGRGQDVVLRSFCSSPKFVPILIFVPPGQRST